mgnify:FL=1
MDRCHEDLMHHGYILLSIYLKEPGVLRNEYMQCATILSIIFSPTIKHQNTMIDGLDHGQSTQCICSDRYSIAAFYKLGRYLLGVINVLIHTYISSTGECYRDAHMWPRWHANCKHWSMDKDSRMLRLLIPCAINRIYIAGSLFIEMSDVYLKNWMEEAGGKYK